MGALVEPTVELIESSESDGAALEALAAGVLADFGAAATVFVDGWTFARTELDLCVLARWLAAPA